MSRPKVVRLLRISIGALVVVSIATFAVLRKNENRLMVGTWTSGEGSLYDPPRLLHIFADHTFQFEGSRRRTAKSGQWFLNGFPGRAQLVLKDFYFGTDTVSDARLDLNLAAGTLADAGRQNWRYTKESGDPAVHLDKDETFVVGDWDGSMLENGESAGSLKFLSNHRFFFAFEGVGSWRVSGNIVKAEWSSNDSSIPPRSMELVINRADDKLILNEPEGAEFVREK